MKIFEIGTGYTPIPAKVAAATEIIIEQLTKSMLKNNIDITLVDIRSSERISNNLPIEEVWVPSFFNRQDISLGIVHKLKRVVYSIFLTFKLHKLINKEKKKVLLHFHNQYNLFFFLNLTSKSMREKVIISYTNHSGIWRMDWSEAEQIIKRRYFQEEKCMKMADFVYVLNKETKKNIVKYLNINPEKVIVINNGVNTEIYVPLEKKYVNEIKRKHGLDGKKVFLQVGSIYENKGQMRTLEKLLPLLKQDKDIMFCYAGGVVSEDYHNEIKDFIKRNKLEEQIKYFGMVRPGKEMNELYNIALASVLASRYEAFGLVVIESLAAGVPVFIDGEFPFNFGEGCIRYSADNFVDVVKEKILCNDEYEELCKKARETAVSTFGWDQIASNYVDSWKL